MSSVFHVEIRTLYAEPLASLPASTGIHNTNFFLFLGGVQLIIFLMLCTTSTLPLLAFAPPPPPLLSSHALSNINV